MFRKKLSIGIVLHVLCAVFWALHTTPIHAAGVQTVFYPETTATDSAKIQVTVIEQTLGPAILVSPNNNTTFDTAKLSLVWKRPNPLPPTPVDTYDVYLDGNILAVDIPDGVISADYFFYTITRIDDTFTLTFKVDLSQGTHTWYVKAHNWIPLTSTSETRSFYIDSIDPHITLNTVDSNTLNWNTANASTIPTVDNRYLYVTQNPTLKGTVEANANLQFVLVCPTGETNCTTTTTVKNYSNGTFEFQFLNLIPNKTYTVYLSSTDAANNSVTFPTFYITYSTAAVTPTATPMPVTPTPTASLTPTYPPGGITGTLTPTITLPPPGEVTTPPEYSNIYVPPEYAPMPPAAPPVPKTTQPTPVAAPFDYLLLLLVLMLIGLPLHLAMSQFGTNTALEYTHLFLATLLYPFLGEKTNQTIPYTTILIYPQDLSRVFQTVISDVKGFFSLKTPQLPKVFLKLFSLQRIFKPVIISSNLLPHLCLYPNSKAVLTRLERLQAFSFKTRIIPLILAIVTSTIYLVLSPNYFVLLYLYFSCQALFSEFLYPKIS